MRKLLMMAAVTLLVGTVIYADSDSSEIATVSEDGTYICLQDNTQWVVDPLDRLKSRLWMNLENVTYTDDHSDCSHWELINTDDKEAVCAAKIEK